MTNMVQLVLLSRFNLPLIKLLNTSNVIKSASVLFLLQKDTSSSEPEGAEQSSIMGKLDEGLDDFFSKKVIKLSFK